MHTTIDRLRIRSLAALVAIAIAIAACSAPAGGGTAPGNAATPPPAAPAAPTTGGGYSYSAAERYSRFASKTAFSRARCSARIGTVPSAASTNVTAISPNTIGTPCASPNALMTAP